MNFLRGFSVALAIACATPAAAQSWQFAAEASGKGVASVTTQTAAVSFSCFAPGLPQHDDTTVEWRIDSPSLVNALPTGIAAVAELELSIDGQSVGKGPFQRISNDSIATRLPRTLPLIGMLRFSDNLTVGVGGTDVSASLPVDTMDAAFSKLLAYCDAPVAAPAAPKRNFVTAIPKLDASGLQGVAWDPKQIQIKFLVEAVRRAPTLLDQDSVLSAWATIALDQKNPSPTPEWRAMVRASIMRSLEATAPGPFLIGQLDGNPFGSGSVYADGLLQVDRGTFGANSTPRNIGFRDVYIPGFGAVNIRARSQFDVTRLPLNQANAALLTARAGNLRLGVVTQVDDLEVVSAFGGSVNIIARGGVRFAGLFENPLPNAPKGSLGVLTVIYPMTPITSPPSGLDAVAEIVGVSMYDGAVLEGRASPTRSQGRGSQLQPILDWALLKKNPPAALSSELRTRVFNTMATRFERDALVDPFFREPTRSNARQIAFAPHVNEFERADLLARIDSDLWPTVLDRLPDFPIAGIAAAPAVLGDYNSTLGGFPIEADVDSLGLPAAGRYPAFRSLPELLPATVSQAKKLISDLEAANGIGNRSVMFVAQFSIDYDALPATLKDSNPAYSVTAKSLSLHGRTALVEGTNPFDLKIQDFDIARHAGPKRPVATPDQVAFWTQVSDAIRSTSDEAALATFRLSQNDRYLETLALNRPAVIAAHLLDYADTLADAKTKIRSLPAPSVLVLDGSVRLNQYVIGSGFPVQNYSLSAADGSKNYRAPRIVFSNAVFPDVLTPTEPVARLAITNMGGRQENSGNFPFTAWVVPERFEYDRDVPVLYVRASRVVLQMLDDQGSGYPAAHVEFKPGAPAKYVNDLPAR